jgi:hypothetical protein
MNQQDWHNHEHHKQLIVGRLLCCFVVLMVGCASSELVDIWSDSSFQPPPPQKILVIGVGKNAVQRRIWEDAFSAELARHDVAATPSYRLFPDSPPDTDHVAEIVRTSSLDGVLITQRLLKTAIAGRAQPFGNDELAALAAHCTEEEDAVKKVEGQVTKSAAAMLLESRIGEKFDAIVTVASEKGT